MVEAQSDPFTVAIVWRGDAQARRDVQPQTSRLRAVFEALERQGITAIPAVYVEDQLEDLRIQLRDVDGVLVWVDPISAGQRRTALNLLLDEVAAAGVFVSALPDVIAKMGVKAVLHSTRDLGWGTDTQLYDTVDTFEAQFPAVLTQAGPRVLKQNRGNGGIGVWKVEALEDGAVRVQEARAEAAPRTWRLAEFMAERAADFTDDGRLIDQPFQARLPEGMIRCYMSGGLVVGFGHQIIRGLMSPNAGPPGPRIMSGPEDPKFQALRFSMECDWTPGLVRRLALLPEALPVIWDADFLLGPKTADGADTYVLCEINVSSVFPIPEPAPDALAKTTLQRLAARRRGQA
ncbi:MAG: Cj0069 family protein [Pseudomonadota bacterium]